MSLQQELENKDFTITPVEYNEGFVDGLLWVLGNADKHDFFRIIEKVNQVNKGTDDHLKAIAQEDMMEQERVTKLMNDAYRYPFLDDETL